MRSTNFKSNTTGEGNLKSANPVEQARQCMIQLVNRMNGDPQLIEGEGKYLGKLVSPYGHGAVLPTSQEGNSTRKLKFMIRNSFSSSLGHYQR